MAPGQSGTLEPACRAEAARREAKAGGAYIVTIE
jgi:hypothetical protein